MSVSQQKLKSHLSHFTSLVSIWFSALYCRCLRSLARLNSVRFTSCFGSRPGHGHKTDKKVYLTAVDQLELLGETKKRRQFFWGFLTQFLPETLVFIHEIIDSQPKLVDLFGHGLSLTVSQSNLIITLFDLCNGCFQAVSALQHRNRDLITHPSKISCLYSWTS